MNGIYKFVLKIFGRASEAIFCSRITKLKGRSWTGRSFFHVYIERVGSNLRKGRKEHFRVVVVINIEPMIQIQIQDQTYWEICTNSTLPVSTHCPVGGWVKSYIWVRYVS